MAKLALSPEINKHACRGVKLLYPLVFKRLACAGIGRNCLAASMQLIFVGQQTFQSNRPPCMQLAVADTDLCAQSITKSISKSSRCIMKDAGSVNFCHKLFSGSFVFRKYAVRVARTILINVINRRV